MNHLDDIQLDHDLDRAMEGLDLLRSSLFRSHLTSTDAAAISAIESSIMQLTLTVGDRTIGLDSAFTSDQEA